MPKKIHKQKTRRVKNPVARVLDEFNKPATHRDKTKYSRKDKKGSQDPFYLATVSDKYFNARMENILQG